MRLTTKTALCWLGMSVMVFSYFEGEEFLSSDPGYENTIVAIDEFATSSGHKIIFRFEQDDPVCTYTPQSFVESVDNTMYRVFMPRTKLAEGVSSSCDLQESEQGIELVLHGISFKKIISGNVVLFIIEEKKN